jgi:hypothetical protein
MKHIFHIIFIIILLSLNACKPEGCTDPKASNFSYEAEKDDGSCEYKGCTDPDALNFDPDAQTDDGGCTYKGGVHFITTRNSVGGNTFLSLEINGQFVGNLNQKCTQKLPDCTTPCAHLKFTDQTSGYYTLRYWEIRQFSSAGFDTLFVSQPTPVQIIGKECNVFTIK